MKLWSNIEGLKEALCSPKKSTMKLKLKDLKDDIVELTFYKSTKGSHISEMPHRLPSKMDSTLRNTLLLNRKEYVASPKMGGLCPVCNSIMTQGLYVHSHTECAILPRQIREAKLWDTITQSEPVLTDHLKGLPKPILLEYVLGLRQFNARASNKVMLQAAEVFFPIIM
jgi:hypothetical protein